MSLDLKTLVHAGLAAVFGLGTDVAPAFTYYRPLGYIPASAVWSPDELLAPCQVLLAGMRLFDLWGDAVSNPDERIVIRVADLAGISSPGAGDFLVDTSGQRRDVVSSRLDPLGEFWTFHAVRSGSEDFGGLAAEVASGDRGDLSVAVSGEDYGGLT